MLGVNLAAWDGTLTNPTTSPTLQSAGIGTFRLPGGSTSDVYHWDIQNGGPLVNGSASIVNMANLVDGLHGEANSVVTINYGTASPEEGAAELAYFNGVPSVALDSISLSDPAIGQTNPYTHYRITSVTRSGTTATATLSSTSSLVSGETLVISGANGTTTGYNRTAVITVTSGTTFTYTVSSNTPATATGTIVADGGIWTAGGIKLAGQSVPSWQTAGFWATLRTQSKLTNDDGLNFLRIGRAAPFNFHYWEVSNEEYGSWEADEHGVNGDTMPMPAGTTGKMHDPTTYISFAKKFAVLAAQIDSTISIGIISPSSSTGDQNDWVDKVMQQSVAQGLTPGFISDHIYPQGPGGESDTALLNAPVTVQPAGQGTNDIVQRRAISNVHQ